MKEIRQKSIKECQQLLAENREKLRNLRFEMVNKRLKNVKEIKEIQKTIARILTVFKEKSRQQ